MDKLQNNEPPPPPSRLFATYSMSFAICLLMYAKEKMHVQTPFLQNSAFRQRAFAVGTIVHWNHCAWLAKHAPIVKSRHKPHISKSWPVLNHNSFPRCSGGVQNNRFQTHISKLQDRNQEYCNHNGPLWGRKLFRTKNVTTYSEFKQADRKKRRKNMKSQVAKRWKCPHHCTCFSTIPC